MSQQPIDAPASAGIVIAIAGLWIVGHAIPGKLFDLLKGRGL